jgi:hypothetical protein
MNMVRKSVLIALAAVSVASMASSAFAQNLDSAREAAIRKCVVAAKKVTEGKGVDNQKAAVHVFKDCMTKEGQRP